LIGVQRILDKLNAVYGIESSAEITLEMDPGTFDLKKLKEYMSIGINRVSLGIQSFDDGLLEKCGRAHRTMDSMNAIASMHRAGLENFSIDLISSLPHLTIDTWTKTLREAVASGCHHVSVYDLQIEDKTAFGRWYSPGIFPLPSDEEAAKMYEVAVAELTASGFEHYEISNYAKAGKRSRHNQKYWRCQDVYGFGMAAASLVDGFRFTRPSNMKSYEQWLSTSTSGSLSSPSSPSSSSSLSLPPGSGEQQAVDVLEAVMLALRTSDGLDFDILSSLYGQKYVDLILRAVQPYKDTGHIELIETTTSGRSGDLSIRGIRLSDPKGFLISNDIISNIFAVIS
jgi:coproporphyrinogen III oxidase-like Fe-S oxidoreductase